MPTGAFVCEKLQPTLGETQEMGTRCCQGQPRKHLTFSCCSQRPVGAQAEDSCAGLYQLSSAAASRQTCCAYSCELSPARRIGCCCRAVAEHYPSDKALPVIELRICQADHEVNIR